MDEFYDWMTEIKPTVPKSFKFGQALDYAIKAWSHLMNYLDCPEIYLDNSIVERSIRPYVYQEKISYSVVLKTAPDQLVYCFLL